MARLTGYGTGQRALALIEDLPVGTIRIAHVCSIDLSLRYLLLDQLRYLANAGYEVTGISAPGPDVPYIEAHGIRHVPASFVRAFTPREDLASLIHVTRVLARERFALVHTHNPKPGLLGQLAATAVRTPVVVNTIHGFYFHDAMPPAWRRFYILMEKIAALQSDAILSQNPEDVRTAVAERICAPERIELLGNGIDLERFDARRVSTEASLALRAELGLGPEHHVIGFIGRLVAEKGLPELFEAFARLRSENPRARLVVIGPADDIKSDAISPDLARTYGIEKSTVFTGLRQDIPELLAAMDVFVLPSHREGFPRAPMEAAAMSLPVVTTDIRGCRETVVHGETGLLVPVRSADALTQALALLLEDEPRRRAFGKAGRALALARFDQRRVFEKVATTYARLLHARGLASP